MSWVQWIGVGILVIVTAILVVDAVTWLIHRILRPRGFAELQEAAIGPYPRQETIDSTRAGAKQSAQFEKLTQNGPEHPEDVRHAAGFSHSAAREHRGRWVAVGVVGSLQRSFRHSRTSIRS